MLDPRDHDEQLRLTLRRRARSCPSSRSARRPQRRRRRPQEGTARGRACAGGRGRGGRRGGAGSRGAGRGSANAVKAHQHIARECALLLSGRARTHLVVVLIEQRLLLRLVTDELLRRTAALAPLGLDDRLVLLHRRVRLRRMAVHELRAEEAGSAHAPARGGWGRRRRDEAHLGEQARLAAREWAGEEDGPCACAAGLEGNLVRRAGAWGEAGDEEEDEEDGERGEEAGWREGRRPEDGHGLWRRLCGSHARCRVGRGGERGGDILILVSSCSPASASYARAEPGWTCAAF